MNYRVTIILLAVLLLNGVSSGQRTTTSNAKIESRVDAFVRSKMAEHHIPGLSLAVVRDGKIVLVKGYGVSNLELNTPATSRTRYSLFSITKTFTAVAVMMLVESGSVALDDPISKYLPDLPVAWREVKIRHLLSHTSGIEGFRDHIGKLGDQTADHTQKELIGLTASLPLQFEPGSKWDYSDTNFYLLGMLIEKVTGKPYEHFLRKRIFDPLKMSDTRVDSISDIIPNRASGYVWDKTRFVNAKPYSPTITFSTAGLSSTVLDLAKWDAALYTDKLLKKDTLNEMFSYTKLNSGEMISNTGIGFGLSPFRGHRRAGHVGSGEGFATSMSRFLNDKVTVILLSNAGQEGFTIKDIENEIAAFYF
ncbi:MAG: serine hydrolase domain-containing protein [Pyrinomonadaceae bacterium]